ncbi:MAG: pyridoxamine 5'-phosphate oxidase family protein [Clostridia bacterium]|nr:pyridoxamine 5'-phosphate oxidase family protein [Clostridia bacterium]
MNKIVVELKKVKIFYIATVEGDKPKVRPFSSIAEFEDHAYICTGRHKETYKQLTTNPHIELSGMYDGGTWLRVSATVVEDCRVEAEQAVLDDPTGPSQLYKAGDGRFVVFKLTDVKAYKFNFYSAPEEIEE